MARVPASDRSLTLDVLRGIAVLGTFLTNVWFWVGNPTEAVLAHFDEPVRPDLSRILVASVANGRFLGMLAILFGIGIHLFADRCARRGVVWPSAGFRRAGVLLLFGAAHYVLLYGGDILLPYALAALVAVMLAQKPLPTLRLAFTLALFGYTLVTALHYLNGIFNLRLPEAAKSIELFYARWLEEPYWRQVMQRVLHPGVVMGLFSAAAQALCLILGGMLMVRTSFLERANWKPWAGGAVALALASGALTLLPALQFDAFGAPTIRFVFGPLQGIAYLVVIAAAIRAIPARPVWPHLANVGRCALSCYLLQSLIGAPFYFLVGKGISLDQQTPIGYALLAVTWGLSFVLAEFWTARGGDPAGRLLRHIADRQNPATPRAT